jgi:hypothetical protein
MGMLVYATTETDIMPEHIELDPVAPVLLACAGRLQPVKDE